MFVWLTDNLGTIVVTLILVAVVVLIVHSIRSDRKKGKSLCGGNCAHCGACHCHKEVIMKGDQMYKIVLEIDGMACGMCESHINDAIRNAFPVNKVSSSHKTGKTEIFAESVPNEGELRKVIEAAGYKLKGMRSEVSEKKGGFLSGLFKK